MADTLRIGSIFGISIELHWIFALLTLFFVIVSPLFGLIWILLFVCVLLHELAHSVTAMRNGLKVKKIILMPLGGASMIDEIDVDPKVEFNTAIVGPIASLVIGGLFGILSIFTPVGIITRLVTLMFILNVFLGILNLLPAFPMDGGRVFRGYLSRKYDRYKATDITAKISKITFILIFVGTVIYVVVARLPLIDTELDLAITVIFIWFLWGGVAAEEYGMKVRKETRGLGIKGAISTHFALVGENRAVRSLYRLVANTKSHIILIRRGGGYAIVDISKAKKVGPAAAAGSISIDIPVIQKGISAADAFYRMESDGTAIAAVVSKGRLVGIITLQQLHALINLHMIKRDRLA